MTGGAGFIGSHIVDRLIREGCEVVVVDDLSSGSIDNLHGSEGSTLEFVKGDICDEEIVSEALRDIDVVFHAAAIVSVQRSMSDPGFVNRVNVQGTSTLLRRAAEAGVRRFVFSSSAAVYGKTVTLPVSEDAPLKPISPYGEGKRQAERLCLESSRDSGPAMAILRYFNVYGPRSSSGEYSGVIRKFAERLCARRPLVVYGDGTQVRDFVNVVDVVSANVFAATTRGGVGGVFNVGSGRCTTINELAELETQLMLGSGERARLEHMPARAGDIQGSCADISHIENVLGFRPGVTLEKGLAVYLDAEFRTLRA
ncbi:MAG: NAD-dependent epimerase/dehydratase family protein [Thaumarchaeota archaeon]|nr:NAD-dependent epimerase/dehydratase family protein [Nitrososphaerota archaeon]